MTSRKESAPARAIDFSYSFNILFFAVFLLTVFSAVAAAWLSCGNPANEHQTELQKELFRVFCAGWQGGLGAIFGLLGGRMTK
jgi:hypothetical protein